MSENWKKLQENTGHFCTSLVARDPKAEDKGISNPSTVLRTGIEPHMVLTGQARNFEVEL